MSERGTRWIQSDVGVLVGLAAVGLALHTLTNGQYGFHRDELATLDDARHLDWGYVAYPPISLPANGDIQPHAIRFPKARFKLRLGFVGLADPALELKDGRQTL